jgi:hypothetical protein
MRRGLKIPRTKLFIKHEHYPNCRKHRETVPEIAKALSVPVNLLLGLFDRFSADLCDAEAKQRVTSRDPILTH